MNYPPVINVNNNGQAPASGIPGDTPSKQKGDLNNQPMHSLDRSHNQQISQGISIRDSYKEQAAEIQNQIKRRPQTGGNNNQV